jgi:hypothetical protein
MRSYPAEQRQAAAPGAAGAAPAAGARPRAAGAVHGGARPGQASAATAASSARRHGPIPRARGPRASARARQATCDGAPPTRWRRRAPRGARACTSRGRPAGGHPARLPPAPRPRLKAARRPRTIKTATPIASQRRKHTRIPAHSHSRPGAPVDTAPPARQEPATATPMGRKGEIVLALLLLWAAEASGEPRGAGATAAGGAAPWVRPLAAPPAARAAARPPHAPPRAAMRSPRRRARHAPPQAAW